MISRSISNKSSFYFFGSQKVNELYILVGLSLPAVHGHSLPKILCVFFGKMEIREPS
jgi:hypothetical protein